MVHGKGIVKRMHSGTQGKIYEVNDYSTQR